MKNYFLGLFLFVNFVSFAQSKDPDEILNRVKEEFNKVEDYKVNVSIKVDVNFLKVPDSKATIYFKQPDQIHLESNGFALLPKEGLNFSPLSFLKKDYTAIYEKDEMLDGHKTSIIKVIPLGDNSDIILTTLWVDQKNNVIRKSQSTTKINGTFALDLKYNNSPKGFPLPSQMIFTFNVEKMNLPKGMAGDFNEDTQDEKKDDEKDKKKTTTGKVYITYTNYKVNIGIPEKIFEEGKSK